VYSQILPAADSAPALVFKRRQLFRTPPDAQPDETEILSISTQILREAIREAEKRQAIGDLVGGKAGEKRKREMEGQMLQNLKRAKRNRDFAT
jgi:hypothetical protein